jgi:hypothetical protein
MRKMKICLLQPSFLNPTSPPYYLADLIGYIKARGLKQDVRLFDLNLASFNQVFTGEHAWLVEYIKNSVTFYDQEAYFANIWAIIDLWQRAQEAENNLLLNYLNAVPDALPQTIKLFLDSEFFEDDIFAFSLTYHLKSEQSQFFSVFALAKYIKMHFPAKKIMIGGALLNQLDVQDIMAKFDFVDLVFLKESEESFYQVLAGVDLALVPNIMYRKNGNIQVNILQDNVRRDLSYLPDLTQLSPKDYLTPLPVVSLQYKRGCAYNSCAFCGHNTNYFAYEKQKSVDNFMQKLSYLIENGYTYFYFADQYLCCVDLAILVGQIKQRRLKCFWTFMARVEAAYTPEFFEELYAAGCRWISWGVESGSANILRLMNKQISIETAKQNIIQSSLAGITNVLLIIYGFPGETETDFLKTLAFLEELKPYYYAHSLSPFHLCFGSAMYNEPQKFGITVGAALPVMEYQGQQIASNIFEYSLWQLNQVDYARLLPQMEQSIPFAEHVLLKLRDCQ